MYIVMKETVVGRAGVFLAQVRYEVTEAIANALGRENWTEAQSPWEESKQPEAGGRVAPNEFEERKQLALYLDVIDRHKIGLKAELAKLKGAKGREEKTRRAALGEQLRILAVEEKAAKAKLKKLIIV